MLRQFEYFRQDYVIFFCCIPAINLLGLFSCQTSASQLSTPQSFPRLTITTFVTFISFTSSFARVFPPCRSHVLRCVLGCLGGCLLAEDEQKFPANQSHFKALQHYHFEEGFFPPPAPKSKIGKVLGFKDLRKKLLPLKKKVDRLLDLRIQTGIPPAPLERLSDKDIFSEIHQAMQANQINWASQTLLSGSCHLTTPERCTKKNSCDFCGSNSPFNIA